MCEAEKMCLFFCSLLEWNRQKEKRLFHMSTLRQKFLFHISLYKIHQLELLEFENLCSQCQETSACLWERLEVEDRNCYVCLCVCVHLCEFEQSEDILTGPSNFKRVGLNIVLRWRLELGFVRVRNLFGMVIISVGSWVVHYVYKGPHKDVQGLCLCVCVHG